MEELLIQIEKSLDIGLYMIALQSALTLPDICGALEYPEQGVGNRYKTWYTNYYHELVQYPGIDQSLNADECYAFRCSFVHQASTKHKKLDYEIVFLNPMSNTTIQNMHLEVNDKKFYCIDIELFIRSMVSSVKKWLPVALSKTLIRNEYNKLPKVHPEGLPPFRGATAIW